MSRISRELKVIKAYLNEIEVDDESGNTLVAWIKEVQKLANQIEDIVVEFAYLVGNSKVGGISFYGIKKPKKLVALKRIAFELSDAERSLEHLAKLKVQWVPPTNARIGKISDHLYSHKIADDSHFIDEDQIVGMKNDRDTLTNWLNSNNQELSVITICGMGGIGKTTLATNVFKRVIKNFGCHAWVNISQSYTSVNLLQNLISEICKNEQSNQTAYTMSTDLRSLKDVLRNLLQGKKYCIVMDNMWDPKAYQELSNILIDNRQGSRIVIATRMGEVASLAPQSNRLELNPMHKVDSWNLFCIKAFPFEINNECPSNLKDLAAEIVAKCDGLPLSLVSLGNMLSLSGNTEIEWKRVNDQLAWQLENNPNLDHLKTILNLSFRYLPRYLKNCFLYCSLFPEDFLLTRKKLTRLWVAEGFIEEKGRSTLEEVAEEYLKELIYRNLLQVVQRNLFGRVKSCRMHDTLRELAISLCTKENFGKLLDDNKPVNGDTSVCQFITREIRIDDIKNNVSLPQLRTFMVFDLVPLEYPWLSMVFNKSRYIRVLNLEGLHIETIPDTVGDLFNLYYLGLRKTVVKILPKSIKKLHNLQTLDLCFTKVQKLPNGIVELKKLRHLFARNLIDATYGSFHSLTGIHLPKGIFYLNDLQTIQSVESNAMVVKELGNLTQLKSFRIINVKENHSAELCSSLAKMSSLSFLSISASNEHEILHLEGLELPQIQKLILIGRLSEVMLESHLFREPGENIRKVSLCWSRLQNNPLPSLSRFKNLTRLHLQRAYEGNRLIFLVGWFPKLKRLVLRQFLSLTQVEMEIGTMASLKQIYLSEMMQLVDIPRGIEHLVSLKWMGCQDMPAKFGGFDKGTHQLFHFTCGVF